MKTTFTLNETVRESIALSLVQLMKKKNFSQISVSEIVRSAGVSRSSFYRNFDSKEQILRCYLHDLYTDFFSANEILPVYPRQEDPLQFLLPRFRFIKTNRDFFTVLRQNNLLYYIFEQMEPELIELLCGQDPLFSHYYLAMFAGSCAGIIRLWIDNDFRESEEDMVALFSLQSFQRFRGPSIFPVENESGL